MIALFVTISALLIFWVSTEKRILLDSVNQTLKINTMMLNQTIRAIMLDGEAPVAVKTMKNLQEIEELDEIAIYRRDGTAAFHDFETLDFVNQYQNEVHFEKTERVAYTSIGSESFRKVVSSNTSIKVEDKEKQIFEFYFPLLNTPDCRGCHGENHILRGVEHLQISVDYAYEQIRKNNILSTIIMLFSAAGVAIVIFYFLRKTIVKPLLRIGDVVQKVGKGNFDVRLSIMSEDELGTIASHVNEMIRGLKERTDELQVTQDVTILSLASLAETRDNETGNHIFRTQHYVRILAEQLSKSPDYKDLLSSELVEILYKSSPLHDIGKVGVPDSILLKPGSLTEEEWVIMKKHTLHGRNALHVAAERLGTSSFLSIAQEITYSHHEKWDGTGYPDRLAGTKIPLSGRLMAVADVYDALRSERPYKKPFSHERTKMILLEGKNNHFDPQIIDAFLIRETDFIEIAEHFRD